MRVKLDDFTVFTATSDDAAILQNANREHRTFVHVLDHPQNCVLSYTNDENVLAVIFD